MKKPRLTSDVVMTEVLDSNRLEDVMASIGALLISEGYSPAAHSRMLLNYEKELQRRRGIYVGLLAPLSWIAPGLAVPLRKPGSVSTSVTVQVTKLPIGFRIGSEPEVEVTAALAFGISAPNAMMSAIKRILAPYVTDTGSAAEKAGRLLVGRTFYYEVPEVTCEHCGVKQPARIPVTVTSVDGRRGRGPAGTAKIRCSNPYCCRDFDVEWDGVEFVIDFT